MASAIRNRKNGFEVALFMICCLSFMTFLPSKSVGIIPGDDQHKIVDQTKKATEMKLVLGSRPPRCINRCMSCRPCMAVLVMPPHKKEEIAIIHTPQDEETYYLLSWKCRCKNKLFQP